MLVTIKEAATLLAVSERTVYRLVKDGKLRMIRITQDTPRIRRAEIEEMVDGLGNKRHQNEASDSSVVSD